MASSAALMALLGSSQGLRSALPFGEPVKLFHLAYLHALVGCSVLRHTAGLT